MWQHGRPRNLLKTSWEELYFRKKETLGEETVGIGGDLFELMRSQVLFGEFVVRRSGKKTKED